MKMIFAGNWKMHHGPAAAADFMATFLREFAERPDREVWFFPPAVSLSTVADAGRHRPDLRVGAQNIHWEPKGAFTGETSVAMARDAGATTALVGHSERRHVFGETDDETGRKVRALLEAGLDPMLCVGETLEQREQGRTLDVVNRQLRVLEGLEPAQLACVLVAYEPVWAIGTGKNATPEDAAQVHAALRATLRSWGHPAPGPRILYGGSVKPANVQALIGEPEIDGVLVGGASLDPASWLAIASAPVD